MVGEHGRRSVGQTTVGLCILFAMGCGRCYNIFVDKKLLGTLSSLCNYVDY